jgi:hypothetical protein
MDVPEVNRSAQKRASGEVTRAALSPGKRVEARQVANIISVLMDASSRPHATGTASAKLAELGTANK